MERKIKITLHTSEISKHMIFSVAISMLLSAALGTAITIHLVDYGLQAFLLSALFSIIIYITLVKSIIMDLAALKISKIMLNRKVLPKEVLEVGIVFIKSDGKETAFSRRMNQLVADEMHKNRDVFK